MTVKLAVLMMPAPKFRKEKKWNEYYESRDDQRLRRKVSCWTLGTRGKCQTVFLKKNVAARFRETKDLCREESNNGVTAGVSIVVATAPRRKDKDKDRRPATFHSCGEDNGLELGRVSQRRVKIGLRLAGSHYNNYGRVAGKLHATVPLTVSPG